MVFLLPSGEDFSILINKEQMFSNAGTERRNKGKDNPGSR